MKDFNYPKKDIVNMYLENGQFVNALKADKKAFTSVLDKIDTMNNKEQQEALNELKKANITSKIQLTNHRWVYLATVLDPEKRKVLGYKIGDTMTAKCLTDGVG